MCYECECWWCVLCNKIDSAFLGIAYFLRIKKRPEVHPEYFDMETLKHLRAFDQKLLRKHHAIPRSNGTIITFKRLSESNKTGEEKINV